jgi:hypothetical protein
MSRRRRRGSGSGSGNQPGQQNQQNQSNQQSQQNRSKAAAAAEAFWGDAAAAEDAEQAPAPVERIRPTPDPGALPRSLGDPPLTPDTAAAHHVAVVYEEAVRAATALAAANGLLDGGDTSTE